MSENEIGRVNISKGASHSAGARQITRRC
jgi:hypothetical protein